VTDRRHSVLVGASKGIGRVLARRLVAAGHQVTVLARSEPEGIDGADSVSVDLADPESVAGAIERLRGEPDFDELVFLQRLRAPDSAEAWRQELAISLDATKSIIDGLLDGRAQGRPGSIVVVSSLASDLVVADQPIGYHAAKAALGAMVRYYAVTLAPDIRVNALTPGQVLKEEAEAYFRENPEVYEKRVRHTPLRRMGTAAELAGLIQFLCSDEAAFVTGQVLVADGGMSLVFQGSLT
jgi:NAD(P)-dependent dehydrogenase (short-subunit alcohol dehydrogenase family)